jgi:MFS family permease
MAGWGWRIPLLVGCLIIPILFWLMRSLQETEAFEHSTHARSTREILRILLEHWQVVLIGILLTILNTTMFYFVNTYTALYGSLLKLDPLGNFTVALSVGTASFILLPVFGALSDRIGRWPLLIGSPVLVLLTAYPAMSWLVSAPSFGRLLVVEFWLAILYAMYAGTLVPFVVELMPAKVRSSGYAIILSLANGLFGTFTPFVVTMLISTTGNRASPALWLSAAAAVSIMTTIAARRMAMRPALHVPAQ